MPRNNLQLSTGLADSWRLLRSARNDDSIQCHAALAAPAREDRGRQQQPPRFLAHREFAAFDRAGQVGETLRSAEHTSELQSLMRTPYAVFSLLKKIHITTHTIPQ